MENHVIYLEARRGGLMRLLIVTSFTIVFIASLLSGYSVMAEDRSMDNTSKELNEKIQMLEKRIEENLSVVSKVAVMTIECVKEYAKYLSHGIALIALVISAVGVLCVVVGAKEIKKVKSLREDLEKKGKQLDNDLFTTSCVARAIFRILQSDATSDKKRKKAYASESLIELKVGEKAGYENATLLNWKAYVLRRCGRLEEALSAAQSALKLGKKEENTYQQGRALYNSACYLTLLSEPELADAMGKLKDAVRYGDTWKIFAINDPDLDKLRKDRELGPEFKKITRVN